MGIFLQAAVQDRLNEQEGVPSVFNPPPARPLQVNTTDHRVYSYIVSRPQPRVRESFGFYVMCSVLFFFFIPSAHFFVPVFVVIINACLIYNLAVVNTKMPRKCSGFDMV